MPNWYPDEYDNDTPGWDDDAGNTPSIEKYLKAKKQKLPIQYHEDGTQTIDGVTYNEIGHEME